jgi:hypothetical protein
VYRVGWGYIPFAPAPWDTADKGDGTFKNRFDDPRKAKGIDRFRAIYCATQRAAAFGETTARFRKDPALLEGLRGVENALPDNLEAEAGVITADWRSKRSVGVATLDTGLQCVDFVAIETMQHLRPKLLRLARQLGFDDVDLSSFTGAKRPLTQAAAALIFEETDDWGNPRFAGIRYISRLNPNWECWAFFDARIRIETIEVQDILAHDTDLQAVASLFGLTIQP